MEYQKKKILYVITKSNFGGAQRYVFELATTFLNNGHDVAVACGGEGKLMKMLESASVKTYTIPSFRRDINVWKEVNAFFELIHILRIERPDIIHLNSSKAGGIGALAARLCGIPKIVFTAHGWPFFEHRNILWKLCVWILSYITALLAHDVIVVSEHDRLHAHMPGVQSKLRMIHTGVCEIEYINRSEARALLFSEPERTSHENDLWIVSTGEHTANKNLFILLDAVKTFNATNSQKLFLTLMSDGEDRKNLEAYVQKHNLTNTTHFTGFVSDAPRYLRAFDVFVLPSRKEGLPYGLLEAGAAGLACIASNVGGIPEVIEHEKNGLLIDPQSTKSLTDAFTILAKDVEKRSLFSTMLSAHIWQDFSHAHMLDQTEKLYMPSKQPQ